MVEKYHSALTTSLLPAIAACVDAARLEEWIVSAADLDDEAYTRRLGVVPR